MAVLVMRVCAVPGRVIQRGDLRGEFIGYERIHDASKDADFEVPGGFRYCVLPEGEDIAAIRDGDTLRPAALALRTALAVGDLSVPEPAKPAKRSAKDTQSGEG